GIRHAPLVGIGRIERAGQAECVGRLLRQPPGVFAMAAVVVITAAEPVHRGDVDGVAPHVFERTIIAAVAADLRMAMELTTDDLQVLSADAGTVTPNAIELGALLLRRVARLSAGVGLNLRG